MNKQPGKNPTRHWGGGQFFTLPTDCLDGGLLARLTRSQLLTMLGLAGHADFKTGMTRPGADLLARKTKQDRRTVEKAIKVLEKMGLIVCVKRGGGQGIALVLKAAAGRGSKLPWKGQWWW